LIFDRRSESEKQVGKKKFFDEAGIAVLSC
jgi:hypothetical protein